MPYLDSMAWITSVSRPMISSGEVLGEKEVGAAAHDHHRLGQGAKVHGRQFGGTGGQTERTRPCQILFVFYCNNKYICR